MIYCMSDIHGEIDRFMEMLKLIEFSDEDTLYIIGDVIDRGSGGVDILCYMAEHPNMILIRGNHEQMCLDTFRNNVCYNAKGVWRNNGGSVTYRDLVYHMDPADRNELLNYLADAPVSLDIEVDGRKFHLVHGWPSDDEDNQIWGRPMDGLGEIWDEDITPIIGHTPTIFLYPNIDNEPFHIHHSELGYICIDCGCGNTTPRRRLACLCLNDMKEYYV